MDFWLCFVAVLVLGTTGIEQAEEDHGDTYPEIDLLLHELDNVIDYGCQLALILWTTDGREDNNNLPSTSEDHVNADRLMNKIRETYLRLGGNEYDRKGFVRDVFTLEQRWTVVGVQYYSFVNYYDLPVNPTSIFKLIEWSVYPIDYVTGFVPKYHLERSGTEKVGYIYVLGRKLYPHYHESLINFDGYCPSYMKLKTLIIDDITEEKPLQALTASGYIN